MNFHHAYALTYQTGTNRILRQWTWFTQTARLGAALLTDIVVILAISWLTGVGYHLAAYGATGNMLSYIEVGSVSAVLFTMINLFGGEYRLCNSFSFKQHLRRTTRLWNTTFIGLLAIGFVSQTSAVFSRGWMVLYFILTLGALLATRYLVAKATIAATRHGLMPTQRIFLFGAARHIEDFVSRYEPQIFGVSIVGCHFLTPVPPQSPERERHTVLASDLQSAVASARVLEPDAIFLVMPWSDADSINDCVQALLDVPAELHLGAESVLDRFENVQMSKLGRMASLQLARLPLSQIEIIEKRIFDIVFASVALILLTPILIVSAILIKFDSPGPVFFLQHRFGFNQKPFRIIKFRTMHTLDDGPMVAQATKNDPRITRVGAWLRRWNIDELPQLFNVIKGDMSLVGPRPHAMAHDYEYERRISLYARRHRVRPGITGWAQIHGFRGETSTVDKMRDRIAHDLFYIENWSLMLDLQIMIRTVISPASYRNAY